MDEWQEHCPIDEEEWLVQRQAWRSGWEYRMEHGPGLSEEEAEPIARHVLDSYTPPVLSAWLQGYSAADNHLRD
jgi:hypothetical protein